MAHDITLDLRNSESFSSMNSIGMVEERSTTTRASDGNPKGATTELMLKQTEHHREVQNYADERQKKAALEKWRWQELEVDHMQTAACITALIGVARVIAAIAVCACFLKTQNSLVSQRDGSVITPIQFEDQSKANQTWFDMLKQGTEFIQVGGQYYSQLSDAERVRITSKQGMIDLSLQSQREEMERQRRAKESSIEDGKQIQSLESQTSLAILARG